ncbi:MAG: hypothetical protein ISR57_09945 [Bacteroidales bacterium]|nr:hypothetical protein [Bacteroidota bacterium]MBL6950951.1 hypothetical protein [Bacteroidales bacterium]
MKKLMKLEAWIAALIGLALIIVGIVMFFVYLDVCAMTWNDWLNASMPFIMWAICMRVFAYTHEEKKKE